MEEVRRKDLKDCQALSYRSSEDLTHPAAISLKDLSEMASTPQNPRISFRRLEKKSTQGWRGNPRDEVDHKRLVEREAADFQHWKDLKTGEPHLGFPTRSDEEEHPLQYLQLPHHPRKEGMGGKRKTRRKTQTKLRASTASSPSATRHDMNRRNCAD